MADQPGSLHKRKYSYFPVKDRDKLKDILEYSESESELKDDSIQDVSAGAEVDSGAWGISGRICS